MSLGKSWRMFNVFHPSDPYASRIEPLLNPAYEKEPPKSVPAEGFHISDWLRTSSVDAGGLSNGVEPSTSPDVLLLETFESEPVSPSCFFSSTPSAKKAQKLTVSVYRLDHVLRPGAFEALTEAQRALDGHGCYWTNESFAKLVFEQVMHALHSDSHN